MAEYINKTDTLNVGRVKLNAAISDSNIAKGKAEQADVKSTQALANSESTQTQLDTIVIDGDSSVEAAQARVDEKGEGHATLKARIDDGFEKTNQQLAQTEDELFKSSLVNHKVGGFNVWWIDDDAQKGVYTKLAPLLREYGIKMSSAVITNRSHGFPIAGLPAYNPNGSWIPYTQMKELHEEGIVEFIPHSHTHNVDHKYTDMTEAELHEDMSTNVRIMRELGWNYKDIPYPFGAQNETVRRVARQYYRSGIDIKGGALTTPLDQSLFPRLGMDTTDTQDIIAEINVAYENNTLIILMSHVDQYGGLEDSKIRAVIEHVQSLGGEFLTADEVINNYGNLLQIGDNSISFDGEIHSRTLGTTNVPESNLFLASTPFTEYKLGITISRIQSGYQDGLPFNNPGTVVTTKSSITEAPWTVQKFYRYNNIKSAERYALNDNSWSEWVPTDNVYPAESYVATSKPSEFNVGTTINNVRQVYAEGLPYNMAGTLVTVKPHEFENAWNHQTYHNHSSNLKVSRVGHVSNDEWEEWEIDGEFITPTEFFNGDTPPSEFLIGTSVTRIRQNRGVDLPSSLGSILTTKKVFSNNELLWTFQELLTLGNEKYIRRGLNDDSWNDWTKLTTD